MYVNKIENRITFKIKEGYYFEPMRLIGSTQKKINNNKYSENVPHLEITEVVSVHYNIVNNDYQHDSWVLHTFFPKKSFGQLLDISPKNFIFSNTFNSEFCYNEEWFTDQNFKPLEIEDKIHITLVINYSLKYKNDLVLSSTKRSNICKRLRVLLKI